MCPGQADASYLLANETRLTILPPCLQDAPCRQKAQERRRRMPQPCVYCTRCRSFIKRGRLSLEADQPLRRESRRFKTVRSPSRQHEIFSFLLELAMCMHHERSNAWWQDVIHHVRTVSCQGPTPNAQLEGALRRERRSSSSQQSQYRHYSA